jgi:hypothetical protein
MAVASMHALALLLILATCGALAQRCAITRKLCPWHLPGCLAAVAGRANAATYVLIPIRCTQGRSSGSRACWLHSCHPASRATFSGS